VGLFERFLSVWVALAIAVGIVAGYTVPDVFSVVASLEYAHVNIVIAVLIWFMIYPMMVQIDFSSIKRLSTDSRYQLAHKALYHGLTRVVIF